MPTSLRNKLAGMVIVAALLALGAGQLLSISGASSSSEPPSKTFEALKRPVRPSDSLPETARAALSRGIGSRFATQPDEARLSVKTRRSSYYLVPGANGDLCSVGGDGSIGCTSRDLAAEGFSFGTDGSPESGLTVHGIVSDAVANVRLEFAGKSAQTTSVSGNQWAVETHEFPRQIVYISATGVEATMPFPDMGQ